MTGVVSSRSRTRERHLCNVYATAARFGLVLGAGVTAQSKIPTYDELALRLLESASANGKLRASPWLPTNRPRTRATRGSGCPLGGMTTGSKVDVREPDALGDVVVCPGPIDRSGRTPCSR